MKGRTSAKFSTFFRYQIGFFASAWMKIYCYWTSFCISFHFTFFKTCKLNVCILNLGRLPGACYLFKLFALFKYFWEYYLALQNCQEKYWMAYNLTHLKYDWSQHNWFVFVVFLIYNFHFSFAAPAVIFRHAAKKLIDHLFSDWFLRVQSGRVFSSCSYVSSSLLFSVAFSNVSRYSTRMEILLYLVLSIINSFLHIQFTNYAFRLA